MLSKTSDGSGSQVKLLVTSEVPIFKVFADDPSKEASDISAHMRSVMDDLVSQSDRSRPMRLLTAISLTPGSLQRRRQRKLDVHGRRRGLCLRALLLAARPDGQQRMGGERGHTMIPLDDLKDGVSQDLASVVISVN